MKMRVAFIGFRHGHVFDVFARMQARPDVEIVACCEEDPATREDLARGIPREVTVTHHDFRALLEEVDCDAVVVGDYYGKRGRIVADCLAAGRHVLSDKPLCTSLSDLGRIETLARQKRRSIGMMLDLRDSGAFRKLRALVREGEIGEVRAVSFGGQHPLLAGSRPGWYHEAGKHGGTLNDIGIHGIDMVAWVTGLRWSRIIAARSWSRGVPEGSHLANAGQFMLQMDNECGVVADVSYFAPDSFGYTLPMYWRFTFWGSDGVAEASCTGVNVSLFKNGEKEGRSIPPHAASPGSYLEAFMREVRGEAGGGYLTSDEVLAASRVALAVQDAADRGRSSVDL